MATVTPQKRTLEAYSETPIAVEVGEQNEKVYIHRDVLTKTSEYFNSYLSGRWTIGSAVKPPDPDTEVHTFRNYTHWLYTENINTNILVPVDDSSKDYLEELTKLYILGNTIDDKDFRNAVMRKIYLLFYSNSGIKPTEKTYCLAYEKTHPDSNLCRILLDESIPRITSAWLEECYDRLPPYFVKQLMIKSVEWSSYAPQEHVLYTHIAAREPKYFERDGEEVTESEIQERTKKIKMQARAKKALLGRKKKAVPIDEDDELEVAMPSAY